MKTKSSHAIIVTVTDDAISDIAALAEKLKASGMTVNSVLPITGVISGTVDARKMALLKKIKGVHAVEKEVTVELPLPGEPQ